VHTERSAAGFCHRAPPRRQPPRNPRRLASAIAPRPAGSRPAIPAGKQPPRNPRPHRWKVIRAHTNGSAMLPPPRFASLPPSSPSPRSPSKEGAIPAFQGLPHHSRPRPLSGILTPTRHPCPSTRKSSAPLPLLPSSPRHPWIRGSQRHPWIRGPRKGPPSPRHPWIRGSGVARRRLFRGVSHVRTGLLVAGATLLLIAAAIAFFVARDIRKRRRVFDHLKPHTVGTFLPFVRETSISPSPPTTP
jgi:hypothetical protein